MKSAFYSEISLSSASWAAFERLVLRILRLKGFSQCSVVGQSGDGGADVLGLYNNKRWLFQVKALSSPVSSKVVTETLSAMQKYGADIPVIVSKSGFTLDAFDRQRSLVSEGISLQLWDREAIKRQGENLPDLDSKFDSKKLRPYQATAIENIVARHLSDSSGSALVVLATGLGKTFVAAEAIRRMRKPHQRVLVLAHTTDLVLQLEKAFWPFLSKEEMTCIFMGNDKPNYISDLELYPYIFATRDSIDSARKAGESLPRFDYVVVDECHHLGAETYERVLDYLEVGETDGPFLLGLTATPWRPDGSNLTHRFSDPVVSVDLARGLQEGYLANVDYRIYTDNIDWTSLKNITGSSFSPKEINRTLFIREWDDAVVNRLAEAWAELGKSARGIVFCGTIDHALSMERKINAMGITKAKAIYSGSKTNNAPNLSTVDRNRMIWDFADGKIGIICAVDILNEGVDVPDVNLVVFQRVTHSRRIFTQQLGRGLRLAEGKDKVIVLDFVTDVRRFAAGLALERDLEAGLKSTKGVKKVALNSTVSFRRANADDNAGHAFLREWLKDLDEVEAADEDRSVLGFPPPF
jgi:superfamily II DNA or RNA helicase